MVRIVEATMESDVPDEFRRYVEKTLQNEWMGEEIEERLWGKTPFGQHFVLVCSKVIWYAVRLIADEEHRELTICREKRVHTNDVLERSDFWSLEAAKEYVYMKHAELTDGVFPEKIPVRVRKLPEDCIDNPEKYLKPGDHIQRRLDSMIPFAHHEGVYLGNGKVAHINTESHAADGIGVLAEKREAHARIDKLEHFVTSPDQEIRVVVHCFRRRTREDICETAKRLANENYRAGEYHLLQQNCQHFAAYCVIDYEWMSDKDDLIEKGIFLVSGIALVASAVYALLHRRDQSYLTSGEEDEKHASASTTRR